jgi:nicotinamide-nucleotide amidase
MNFVDGSGANGIYAARLKTYNFNHSSSRAETFLKNLAHQELVETLANRLIPRGLMLVTAESCTGGWLAQAITSAPGSSQWFERGFVTYSNASKHEVLGVKEETLARYGAVSGQSAEEMAAGALRHSHAQVSVAITGIAGPGGGSDEKPVGTVWIAWGREGDEVQAKLYCFTGDRHAIRGQAVTAALRGLIDRIQT